MPNSKILATLTAIAAVGASHAVIYFLNGPLEGSQEVPPKDTTATGVAYGEYDSDTNLFHMTVEARTS